MKRVKTNYHTLQVLKTADPKLRKVIISKCNKEVVLTGGDTRKLQKLKAALRKVSDKRVPLSAKKKLIVQRGGFLLHLLSAILHTLASLNYRNHVT